MSKISFYSSPGNVRERCQLYTNSVLRKYLKVKINAYFRYINKFVFLSAFLFEKNINKNISVIALNTRVDNTEF